MDIDAYSVRDTTGHPKSHSNVEKWTPPRRGVAKWPCETVRLWPLISRRVDCDGRVTGRERVLFHVACPCASTSSYSSNWCLVPNSANAVMARWSCNKVSSNTINFMYPLLRRSTAAESLPGYFSKILLEMTTISTSLAFLITS